MLSEPGALFESLKTGIQDFRQLQRREVRCRGVAPTDNHGNGTSEANLQGSSAVSVGNVRSKSNYSPEI